MRLQSFLIALLAFLMCSIVVLSLVLDMYSEDGFDVDLNADNDTVSLGAFQESVEASFTKHRNTTEDLWSYTIGQNNASIESGSLTDADLQKSSLLGLTNVGTYTDIFSTLFTGTTNALGIGQTNPVVWFFGMVVVIVVALILLSIVFPNRF